MTNQHAPCQPTRKALHLLLALILVIGLIPQGTALLANPDTALAAQTAKFTTTEVSASGHSYQMYAKSDGSLAYCYDPGKEPPTTSATYTLTSKKDTIAAWIVANGYPFTKEINGKSWTNGQAQCITQIALWFYRSYGSDPSSYYDGCDDYMKTLFHDASMVDAALVLAKKALRYDGSDPSINGCATIWNSSDSSMQDTMLVGPMSGKATIKKKSNQNQISANNSCYSLKGAVFGIFSDKNCSSKVDTLTTNAKGNTPESKDLPAGTYYVKELTAPEGYELDNTVRKVTIEAGETATIDIEDTPLFNPLELLLQKLDAETGEALPLGSASLSHAQFTVSHYGEYYDTVGSAKKSGEPLRTWIFATDENGEIDLSDPESLISGDKLYELEGKNGFPLGTYVFEETQAPEGYLPCEPFCINIGASKDNAPRSQHAEYYAVGSYASSKASEQVARGDVSFVKADEETQARLANCAFLLTSTTTGESHVLVTDPNGHFSTKSFPHETNTNANDDDVSGVEISQDDQGAFTKIDVTKAKVNDDALNYEAGTWFGINSNGNAAQANNDLCALPYDTYILTELPCRANSAETLGHPVTLYAGSPMKLYKDGLHINLGTIDNQPEEIPEEPSIGTLLIETGADKKNPLIDASEKTKLTDVVEYKNLQQGTAYRFASILFDATTDLPILTGDFMSRMTPQELQAEITKLYAALGIEAQIPKIAYERQGDGSLVLATEGEDQVLQSNGQVDYAALQTLLDESSLAPFLMQGTTDYDAQQEDGTLNIDLAEFDSRPYQGHTTVCFEVLYNQEISEVDAIEIDESNTNQQISFNQEEPKTPKKDAPKKDTPEKGSLYKTGSMLWWILAVAGIALFIGSGFIIRDVKARRASEASSAPHEE